VSRLQSSGCVGFGQAVRSFERWALANPHFMQCRKCCGWMGQTAARLAGRCGSNLSPAPESLVEDVGQQSNTNDRSAAVLSLEPGSPCNWAAWPMVPLKSCLPPPAEPSLFLFHVPSFRLEGIGCRNFGTARLCARDPQGLSKPRLGVAQMQCTVYVHDDLSAASENNHDGLRQNNNK
jgi:hypothetical protein